MSSECTKHSSTEPRPSAEARLFHALTEHATDAIGVLDVHGAIRSANPAFCRMLDAPLEDVLGTSAFAHVHPDDVAVVAAALEEIVHAPGATASVTYRVRAAGGGWRSRRVTGRNHLADPVIGGIVVSACDDTQRGEPPGALDGDASSYHRPIATWHDGMCTVGPTGSIIYANRRLADMLGYDRAELAGRLFFDFMAPDAAFAARTRFARQQLGISEAQELSFRRKDGSTLWARQSVSPMLDPDGHFAGATYVLADVSERRLAEDALRESEARYRLLFERNPLPLFVVDLESRQFLAVNEAALANYGYGPDEFLAMRADDLRLAEDRAAFLEVFATTDTKQPLGVLRHVRKDGSLIDVDIVRGDVTFGDRPARLVMARDVTEYRRTKAALRDAHQFMTTLVDAAPLAILTTDRDGLVQSWNATAERMFGWPAAAVVGHANPLVLPAQQQEYTENLRILSDTGQGLAELERRVLRSDGTLLDVAISTAPLHHPDGTVSGEVALISDITWRRKAAAALHEARRQTELLLASAGEGIFAVDAEGRTTFVNPAAARLLGSTSADLVGHDAHTLVHHTCRDGDGHDAEHWPINATLRDGTVQRVDTDVFCNADGTSYPVEYVSTPLVEDGQIIGAVVAFQDITRRRSLEQQLRQGQKMEAIGRLAGGVAHDFNNLLTVITGYTAMLLAELPADDPSRPDLREIQAASARAAGLTRQLLAFSRQQVLDPRVIDLQRVVANMEGMLRRLIGEDIEMSITRSSPPAHVHADPGQIEQIVMNLVVNARDAMPSGGQLMIDVGEVPLTTSDAARYPYVVPGEYVRIQVRDTGEGIDAITQTQMFEPFFTTKPLGQGTGLGLATVYGIVKQSGGYIWVDSAPGEGAAFRIYLPRVTDELDSAAFDTPQPIVPARRGATVLVVEDDDSLRAIIERVLQKRGHTVLAARCGADALAMAEQHDGPVDLLVTDVVMPKMSGQELADRIAERHGEVPVLFVSGHSPEAVTNHGVLRVGSQLLKKPFTPQALALATSELLHRGLSQTGEHRISGGEAE